jgi:uncharacterized membrane-anchored protein
VTEVEAGVSQVPEITLAFWMLEIAATTLGEPGGANTCP